MRPIRALLIAGALMASACAGGETEAPSATGLEGTTITFSVSLAEEERAGVSEVIETFQRDTGATVNLTSITSADLPEKLRVDVGAGRPTVHLFAQDNLALRTLVDGGLVEDLSAVELPDGIVESMIPERFDDKQYFLPFRPNVQIVYVNRARFEAAGVEPPTTTEELRTVGAKLKDGGGRITIQLAEGDPAAVTVAETIVSFGGDPLILNDDGSKQAFTYLRGLWSDGVLARESLQAKFDTQVDFLRSDTKIT